MTTIILIFILGGLVHFISTSAYAVKSAGALTKKIALAYTLFNLFEILSRTANALQAPLLAAKIEKSLINNSLSTHQNLLYLFQGLVIFYFVVCIFAYLMLPISHHAFVHIVRKYEKVPKLKTILIAFLEKVFWKRVLKLLFAISFKNYVKNTFENMLPWRLLALNVLATSFWTVGALACLYAGVINPDTRLTSVSLSAFINGWATVVMFLIIDPYLAIETEKAIIKQRPLNQLKQYLAQISLSKAAGTLLGVVLIEPCAHLIVWCTKVMTGF